MKIFGELKNYSNVDFFFYENAVLNLKGENNSIVSYIFEVPFVTFFA
jgi:hypothetical protein